MLRICSTENPRRFKPSALIPRGSAGWPDAVTYAGMSFVTTLAMPSIACGPMWQNWCTPVKPPSTAKSPTCTWPASCVLFAKIVLLPIRQSCAMCTYAMIQLSLPIVVSPRSCTVPRLIVHDSRIVLRSPITSRVRSPLYFLSCGASPIEANWKMWLSAPITVGPLMTTCGSMRLPRPISTSSPMSANAPTCTSWCTRALLATTARESITPSARPRAGTRPRRRACRRPPRALGNARDCAAAARARP